MRPRIKSSHKNMSYQQLLRQLSICFTILYAGLSSLFFLRDGFPRESPMVPVVGPQSIKAWYDAKIDPRNKIVVVYTGPSETDRAIGKNWLYLSNFDYFLVHGIDCLHHDTILVLTDPVAELYAATIHDIQKKCGRGAAALRIVIREDKCYDMEGFRSALALDLSQYDYLVYLNCGVVGPRIAANSAEKSTPWTHRFISLLSDEIKMSGLSMNCDFSPHVQSMLFAVDRIGLNIIKNTVYDCHKANNAMDDEERWNIITKYEVGMGRAILNAGYGMRTTHGMFGATEVSPKNLVTNNRPWWCAGDMWHLENIIGALPPSAKWEDLMFFKTSRLLLLPGMAEELHYGHEELFETVWPENPYTLFYWENLPVNVQEAAKVLGMNEDFWDEEETNGVPAIFLKEWEQLTDEERTAAREAGFNMGNWHDND